MDNETMKVIISLIKSALYKEKTIIPPDFDWDKAKFIIDIQEIHGLMYYGMVYSGYEVPKWLEETFLKRVTFLTRLWQKGEELQREFKKANIEFIPLKGIKLKDMYPDPYMRHMSDVDILIHECDYEKKVKPIMISLGYEEGTESDHELHWTKDGQMIELHKRIIPSYNKDFYRVIGDGWEWLKDDNEYAFIFTHFAKHYRDKGIGIGHLVDLEVIRNSATDKGLDTLHLEVFYKNVLKTLDCWFRDEEYDEITKQITKTVFYSGEYGTSETSRKSQNLKKINAAGGSAKKARLKDFILIVFPTYSSMKSMYPFLKYVPILLPLMWIFRIIRSFFRGNIIKIYKSNKSITHDKSKYKEELAFVGLGYYK